VGGESRGFLGDAFLQTAVTGTRNHMMVENPVLRRVETCLTHFGGNRITDSVGDALPERACRGFDTGCFTEFAMTRRNAVKLAEVSHLFKRDGIAGKMQPTVEEHAAVPGGQDKSVTVEPTGVIRIVLESVSIQNGRLFRWRREASQDVRICIVRQRPSPTRAHRARPAREQRCLDS